MKDGIRKGINIRALLFCTVLANIGCTSTGKGNDVDPYESFNRPVHKFNNKVDTYVAKPLADAYKAVTPVFFQKGVNNFFSNLQDVNVIINDFLQAKFKQSAQDIGRLTLNTTAGFGGLVDVASTVGLGKHDEDFGQTLAVWGIPQGNYLVLPFLGPSPLRELPGYVVDTATNPGNYLAGVAIPLAGVSAFNSRAKAEGSLQFINEAALDPYVFMRESYLQWRQYQATDGVANKDKAMDDLENELLTDDKVTPSNAPTDTVNATNPTDSPKTNDTPAKLRHIEPKRIFNNACRKLPPAKPPKRLPKRKRLTQPPPPTLKKETH